MDMLCSAQYMSNLIGEHMEQFIQEWNDVYSVLLNGEGTKPDNMFGKMYKPVAAHAHEMGVYIGRFIEGKEHFGGACFSPEDLAKLLLLAIKQGIPSTHPVWEIVDRMEELRPKQE